MYKGFMVTPNVGLVKLTRSDSDIVNYVFCSIPGGIPQFSLTDPTKSGAKPFPVVDAPQCDSLPDLLNFCNERFFNEDDN